ncbi:tetratricopeptide repeat protein [Paraglaciecola chathamensis]|jgi:putative thioredoxin|uniref:Tetratricopeptide repeat protein n=3 Tax=Paraglaciecola chathamensis TaxID=368405 RepID=A0ABS0WEL0_9ALTE|nr:MULTISPECIES: tetratricopeptide repeat protein [Paraglaciecola]AEE21154.1 Thioredoxin domain-containing protein [Glaciecola sp. 4H-3-7+YE-5]MBN27250.1 co-chaperone YbbN [Alteromonadaceae bacterium]MBJ2136894.1 tetratricopeptide repeat protein [Paraglaciecola chathamensis]MBU3017033.1 tetratricopeptide repeat protein [Paraglaciecola agarilytica]MDO6839380.1 tetratricopeptide repeat protein [Paraglaciecola chathamensis]|tara:strand:+ start:53026 stop:53871 length:846 start_codon:yes stop_codon:yes gene_type:complete
MHNSVDISIENFQQVILQESANKLVMVEFWAQGYEPSEQLAPVLQTIASKQGENLLHARVDCQAQPDITAQFGVQNLPTVMLIKDGQPVDGFAGVESEANIQAMLDKHLPKPEDELFAQATAMAEQANYQEAFTLVKQAFDLDPNRADIKLLLADCQVEVGQVNQAKELLATIGLVDQDGYYRAILGKIELAEQAAESPEIIALQQALENDPDNLALKVKLAVQMRQANQLEEALSLMHSVLLKDINFEDAKKLMLDMINALPDGEPLKSQYRRKVYSLLY